MAPHSTDIICSRVSVVLVNMFIAKTKVTTTKMSNDHGNMFRAFNSAPYTDTVYQSLVSLSASTQYCEWSIITSRIRVTFWVKSTTLSVGSNEL